MLHSPAELAVLNAATTSAAGLDAVIETVEQRLAALSEALRLRDAPAIELQADELHHALEQAVKAFMHAARHGGVPEPMRARLARASAQVARQRETLARATAALDRAIDVLMSGAQVGANAVYGASGRAGPAGRGGSYSA